MSGTLPKLLGYGKRQNALVERLCPVAHNPRMSSKSKIRPEDVAAISLRMKALRLSTGLSQEQFAKSVGLSYKQWGNYESAVGRIGLDAALTLSKATKIPLDWIYLGEEAWVPASRRDSIRAAMATLLEEDEAEAVSRAS